jgi:hypothetical protein
MPQALQNQAEGTVLTVYPSGLRLGTGFHRYAPSCSRADVRPGDQVRLSLDVSGQVTAVEITVRGAGLLPPDTLTEGQRGLLSKIIDDRERSVEDLDRDFLTPYKGKRFGELTKTEAGLLISFFFGRERTRTSNRPR